MRPPSPWTSLPVIGHLHLLHPLLHQSLQKLSTIYGPIFHLKLGSVPSIIVSSPDLAKLFLKTNELTFANHRFNTIAMLHVTFDAPFATAPYGPYWKFIKKLCVTEILGARSLNRLIPLRRRETHQLLTKLKLKADKGEVVNVTEELLTMTNDVISQMMIGKRCSDTDAEEVRGLVREVTQIFGEFNVADFIWVCRNMDFNGYRKRFQDLRRRFDAFLERIISAREEEITRQKQSKNISTDEDIELEDQPKCFLDTLLDVKKDENADIKLTRNQIKAVILDFLTAATDTSSSSIEWAMAELINNPKVLKAARDEIDSIIGSGRIVDESDVPNLPYMQAVMKETYRLHPPIPLIIRRSFVPAVIGDYAVPAGTLLFVNTWAIGRNPKYWAKPTEFRPNRFLDGEAGSVVDLKGQHFELLPFGTGRRGCPGMMMALQELPMVVGAMIQCFDWKPVCPVTDDDDSVSVDMSERPGLTVPRKFDLLCVTRSRINSLDKIVE
ncbi:unnamed protein product [Rhodiola kirilowii]